MKANGKVKLNTLKVLLLFMIPFLGLAQEKHLVPIDEHPAVSPVINASFYERNKNVLYGDSRERPAIKITVIPSFDPVFTIAFNRDKIKIRKGVIPQRKDGVIDVEEREIRPSKKLYDRLSQLFCYALSQTKVDTDFSIGLDGESYYLSSFVPFKGQLMGMLWSPPSGSDMDDLTKLISGILNLEEGNLTDDELYKSATQLLDRLKQ